MAIQFNDITAIGDVFEIHTNTPIIGIQSISGYTDVVLNETVDRYFYREFRYSLNGITYSSWVELTSQNLIDTFVGLTSIFDIQYRYTRAGTDTTGYLTFISIELLGVIEEVENPNIFTDLYFNKFFNYNDDSVLQWALNVLNKLYKRGIVANYMVRETDGINDDDYIAFFGALTHFMAILVRYAREFRDFTLNDILLTEYLKQNGVFVNDGMELSDLQIVLNNIYLNFLQRGTNKIVDGELLRIIRKRENDEFIWGLLEIEKTIWNINNNSPMYKGTKGAVNLIKAYEFTEDVGSLNNYPLVESGFVSLYTDVDKDVLRILNSTSVNISGIGGALVADKLIIIDSRLSYEITFYVKQAILGASLSCQVYLYDEDEILLTDCPLNAVSGAQANIAIDKEQLLQNDEYYFIRIILFNENISTDSSFVPDIGFGNHLIINNSEAKFMSIELGTEINDGNNDLRIWDFKVRPLMTNIPNGFIMIPNLITSFLENNSEDNNLKVQNIIKRYLIPYNCILKNQFLDELYVPSGTPLRIASLTYTDETVLGAENGTITIVAVGGVAPYLYSIDNGVTFQSSGIFTNLAPATYNIVVEDEETTQVTDSVIISAGVSSLALNVFITKASKLNVSDGQATIIASGGVPPYFYSINGINFFVTNIFTGLSVGGYTAYVRDSNLTEVNKIFNITAVRNRTVVINVKDEKGVNVQSALIVILGENYYTNSSGNVTIYLADGSYNFNIYKSGYKDGNFNLAITGDRTYNAVIQTYYNITFNVLGVISGEGLPNTTIQSLSTPSGQPVISTSTPKGSGAKVVNNVIAGNYVFRLSKSGYVPKNINVLVDGNEIVNESLPEIHVELIYQVGTYQWQVPVGVTSVLIECYGGGASGTPSSSTVSGNGGAGGQYVSKNLPVTAGQSYTLVVGSGGQGQLTGLQQPGLPSSVTYGATIIAYADGGQSRLGSMVNGIGDIVRVGGNGSVISGVSPYVPGAGGGGAGSDSNGGNAINGAGGFSGGGLAGVGADAPIVSGSVGQNGLLAGGGGSGGRAPAIYKGGDGGDGLIKLTFDYNI